MVGKDSRLLHSCDRCDCVFGEYDYSARESVVRLPVFSCSQWHLSLSIQMLPMFQGADKLFRKVLVPLARLQEMLLLRDAIQVKKQMLKDLPHERAVAVRQAIAQFYADDNATTIDPAEVPGSAKKEYLTAWGNINPFRRTDTGEGEPSETTPIV
jgi:hypothetical protein